MLKRIAILCLISLSLGACGKDPQALLNAVIMEKGFIPYKLPMADTRVGTMLRGNDNEMYLVARPETCFPDEKSTMPLRWLQPTDLPAQYKRVEFQFNAGNNPVISVGNPVVTFKANASYVKTVELEFKGAAVEFLEESSFRRYFNEGMSDECRSLLLQHPFIGQGLRIEGMTFTFKDAAGGNIDLSTKMNEVVGVAANVRWYLENNYTLKIETPKYIGYRMARLTGSLDNYKIEYASTVDKKGEWQFRDVDQPKASFMRGSGNSVIAEPLH